jgi:hypothetical protein
MTATTVKQARTLVSRAVVWAGLALGTAVTVLAVMNGIRIPRLETVLSVLATWALLAILAIVTGELLRRHHRTIAGHAVRHGKRGALAAARGTRRGTRSATTWLVARAGPRWAIREHQPLMFRRLRGGPERQPAEQVPAEPADDCTYSSGHARQPYAWPADGPEQAYARARQMSTGGEPYVVTEYPPGGGPGLTIATYVNGKPSQPPAEGTTTMPASKISTGHRAQRAARAGGGAVPSEWAAVVATTADFEPESDEQLLGWMARQVTGLSAWAEALVDTYEHCVNVIGIDPQASTLLHDVADAAAQAAETMSAAKAKFTEHYELPREFAANGGLMTHDGRWVTGEGA